MASLDSLIAAWDEGHREFAFVFDDLPDEDVWRRPHPNLLSIGELAGHVAYWQAVRYTGPGPIMECDLALVKTKSPLVDDAFRYYTSSVAKPVGLGLSATEVLAEVQRVHEEAKAAILALAPDTLDPVPSNPRSTYESDLNYQIFHIAYHTGQAYSVRHMLGHVTTDN